MKPIFATLAVAGSLFLAGCDENDAVSVKVRLKDDGSGTLTVSGMVMPTEPSAVERAAAAGPTSGLAFDKRVELSAASGRFTALTGISVADIAFASGEGEGGFRFVTVTVPQGNNARWPATFVPFDERTRLDAAGALDPSGKAKDVGQNIKIEIELPAPGVGNGVTGKVRGTKASLEGATATLVVPIQASKGATEPLVWHLTWQK